MMQRTVFASSAEAPGMTGIGWRQPHYAQLLAERPCVDFLEVHAENFFMPGGAARALLREARLHHDISLHGVGLSLGSATGLDHRHLACWVALVQEVQPFRVSEHIAFSRGALGPTPADHTVHAGDLLPLPRTRAALARLIEQVQQAQDALRRPLALEHISAYLRWVGDEMSEPDFLSALVRASGCELLLDVNNLIVQAKNLGEPDPLAWACAWMDGVPAAAVSEIHLAGHSEGGDLVIDDHAAPVAPMTWAAYAHAVRRFGPVPTLIEWDTDLPSLATLLAEKDRAARLMQAVLAKSQEPAHA